MFIDPPYRQKLAEKSLTALRTGGWLVPDALVVVEEAKDAGFTAPEGYRIEVSCQRVRFG